jgi:Asp-tRNA(Asn)/Glu-tRNA(Gln) amidotransferase A subunit family amidase
VDCRPENPLPVSNLRIGVIQTPRTLCDDTPIDPEIKAAVDVAIGAIRPLVAEVHEMELPNPEQLGRLIDFENYAFHAQYLARTPERYDPRTRDTILSGQKISEVESTQLRRDLDQHRAAIRDAFSRVSTW